jgi:hypothetical protein
VGHSLIPITLHSKTVPVSANTHSCIKEAKKAVLTEYLLTSICAEVAAISLATARGGRQALGRHVNLA